MIPEVIFKKFGLIHTGRANRPLRATKLKVKNRQAYFKPFIEDGENWVKVYRDRSNYEFGFR